MGVRWYNDGFDSAFVLPLTVHGALVVWFGDGSDWIGLGLVAVCAAIPYSYRRVVEADSPQTQKDPS